jgi:peptidoglycan glycosyltransferase
MEIDKKTSPSESKPPTPPERNLNKNIKNIFALCFIALFALIAFIFYTYIIDRKNIITNPNNPRLAENSANVARGTIYDSNKNILAESVKINGKYVRNYPYGANFAHLIGNVQKQRSGVEAKYNFELETLEWGILNRLWGVASGADLFANNIVLTIDADFQNFVAEALGERFGAVVCVEPKTGKILATASYPNYDPNRVVENWEYLSSDEERSPLLNRASKGLYAPGSVFKIIDAVQIIRSIPNYAEIYYQCSGEEIFDGSTIKCFNKTAHGRVNLADAFRVSCNTYFATAAFSLDNDALKKTAQDALFNKALDYPLEYSRSSFTLNNKSGVHETAQSSIGQGKTLATPLHLALITSAIANGGILMKPYILNRIETPAGTQKQKTLPKISERLFTLEESEILTTMAIDAAQNGTGAGAAIPGVLIAGKTGSAQTGKPDDRDHGLFAAFAPAEDPKIAISIVLEESGGSSAVLPVAKKIIQYYLENY